MDDAAIIQAMKADLGNEYRDRMSAPEADARGRPLAANPARDAANKARAESDRADRQAAGGEIAGWNSTFLNGQESEFALLTHTRLARTR